MRGIALTASLVAALLLGACGGDSTGPGGDGGDGGGGGGGGGGSGSLPMVLVGTWDNGSVSAIGFYDPNTDEWSSGGGIGFSYTLHDDGTYDYAGLAEIYDGYCTTTIFFWVEGEASATDSSITFRPKRGHRRYEDGCTGKTTEGTPNMDTATYRYERETTDGTTWLTLTDADGSALAYRLEE